MAKIEYIQNNQREMNSPVQYGEKPLFVSLLISRGVSAGSN